MPPQTPSSATSYPPVPSEQPMMVVHRHSFGLVMLYLQAILGICAALVLIYFLVTSFVDASNRARVVEVFGILGIGAVIFTSLILAIATYIYRQSRMEISANHLTQVVQTGLLSRRISQLNLSHIEDVTAEQNGLFAKMFDFGTVNVETAGEQENFHFTMCPQPNQCAQFILNAHQTKSATNPSWPDRPGVTPPPST